MQPIMNTISGNKNFRLSIIRHIKNNTFEVANLNMQINSNRFVLLTCIVRGVRRERGERRVVSGRTVSKGGRGETGGGGEVDDVIIISVGITNGEHGQIWSHT